MRGGALGELAQRNYWQIVSENTSNGLKLSIDDDGTIHVTGTGDGRSCRWFSAAIGVSKIGLVAGSPYTIKLYGDTARASAGIYVYNSAGSIVVNTSSGANEAKFTVPESAVTAIMRIDILSTEVGEGIDLTLRPMLNEGSEPLPYVPYL